MKLTELKIKKSKAKDKFFKGSKRISILNKIKYQKRD